MEDQRWELQRPGGRPLWVRLGFSAVVLWATIMLTMVFFEESMIFFPDPYPSGQWDVDVVSSGSGATIEDCFFESSDGVRLHGWWCRPRTAATDAPSEMVLLWFHGNAGNLAHRAPQMLALARIPVQVFIVDYRGYGRSEGKPDEQGLYRDGRAAWDYLTGSMGVAPERIVIHGVSLGGAVAVNLATEVEAAGLIVQSSFTSVPDMAAHHYRIVPRWLVRTRMDSAGKIGDAGCPVMVIHSPDDEVVPFAHGKRLFEAARGNRRFLEIPGAAHNETWLVGGDRYFAAIREFLEECDVGGGGGE
jgi:fermentation-respiration switch protein FrsA (DUF1100 family)